MLKQSIDLNFSIVAEQGKNLKSTYYFILCVMLLLIGWVWWENPMSSLITGGLGIGISVVMLYGILRRLFHQSLFTEDAYTYMTFPISDEAVIKGKLVVGLFWMMWNSLFTVSVGVFLYLWWRDDQYGVTYWDLHIAETLADDLNLIAQMVFGCRVSPAAIVFLIGTVVIQILLACLLICSQIQLGAILNHIYNPNGRKTYIKLLLFSAGLLIFAGSLFLPTWIFTLCTDGMITVVPIVLTMGIEVLAISCFVRGSIRQLERKYELN